MKFSLLTLFPRMFHGPFEYSIIKRAIGKKIITIDLVNMRDFAIDKYKTVDDKPYGGGAGMVMKVDVIDKALEKLKVPASAKASAGKKSGNLKVKERIILLDPKGKKFTQQVAKKLAKYDHLILVCGHYEGVDERVKKLVDNSISIGDYILTGGEIPAMVIIDAVTRLLPEVIGKESVRNDTNPLSLHKYPQYTRPKAYKGFNVPKVLLSGNHQKIEEWRKKHEKKLLTIE